MAEDDKLQNVKVIESWKTVAWKDGEGKQLREGEKPSAPPNLVLPKPVKVPVAPAAANKSDKK
jgi:hypothetical protein